MIKEIFLATVAQHIIAALEVSGVHRVYGVSGDSLNGFTDAIRRSDGIRWEHVRHEEAAALAATADAEGFSLYAIPTILAGRGDELLDLVSTNVARRLLD
jgi:TPP-dependent 2-oxoacid decarboxylase